MRIAFVDIKDANDRRSWSGTVYHMRTALERAGAEIDLISPLDLRPALGWRLLARATRATTGKQLLWERVPGVGRALGRQVDRRLAASKADWIVSPSSLLMPWIRDRRPKAFWTDATFDGMLDFYLKRSDSLAWSRRLGSAGEQAALRAVRLAVYSSEWAAQTARDHYETAPGRVVTIPYGPNLELIPAAPEVRAQVARKTLRPVNLLFIGADWQRKRAAFAIEVAKALQGMGVPTTLDLVGCQPPPDYVVPPIVRLHGFISKNTEEGRHRLRDLYRAAHFFVLPSEAEACAMVLAEAISYGVPLVGTAVGGMATIVREGISGRLFPLGEPASAYAAYIAETLADRDRYLALANTARSLYDQEINWSIAGRRFLAALGSS
jgi:glycosyltransferase involved in cell wall biosynthesis